MTTRPLFRLSNLLRYAACGFAGLSLVLPAPAQEPARKPAAEASPIQFREIELPERLTVGYAVRLIDMNGDDRLDIVVLDSKRLIWLANPNWEVHTIYSAPEKTDNVSFAPSDIDGDGRLDFALAADWTVNPKQGGTIQWLRQPEDPSQPWELFPIGAEPTVHRMNFGDLDDDGKEELLVLPLMGRNSSGPDFAESGVRFLRYVLPGNPTEPEGWKPEVLTDELHVTHNFDVTDLDHDGVDDVLVVAFEGVHWICRGDDGAWKMTRIGEGDQQSKPRRGASEIRRGLLGDQPTDDYIATIEPWHGDKVVVYLPPRVESEEGEGDDGEAGRYSSLWKRIVIDDELEWGHAVKTADLDGDLQQELIVGVRDPLSAERTFGVRIYDPKDADGAEWTRTFVDPGGVAVEDLDVGDLNNDGKPDIVAVGRKTGNIKIYLNETGK
ncbi:MAG TPA: FG-GAP-like repeat-containing protein [Pirellulaceae bacterium]|jgi:hypothetical protein|nr:FG-GAP-like repeat-containing protein [Pirellulaceae bacterium]